MRTVATQDKGSVLATKAVETQGKGSGSTQGKDSGDTRQKAVSSQ